MSQYRFGNNILFFLILCFTFTDCTTKNKDGDSLSDSATIAYAKGFSIDYYDNYTIVKVKNPWDSTQILHSYILIDKKDTVPSELPEGTVVKVPVDHIACFYSSDASIIEKLGDINKVIAIAETDYVKMPVLTEGLNNGTIADIGNVSSLNIEQLMDVSPDIIITSPFRNSGYGKLETTGISIVENASYMENLPLGRVEWIRFIAAFLKKEKEAGEMMKGIEKRYLALKGKVKDLNSRPTVLSEKKYGQDWYVPGGDSYMAHFYNDAGADYIWKEDSSTGSFNLNFESVYEKAENADFWIIKSDKDLNYEELKEEFEPYSYFKAWKDRKIIYCNSTENYYYEEGILNPDLILADLICCFYPEMLPDHSNRYFKPLNDK